MKTCQPVGGCSKVSRKGIYQVGCVVAVIDGRGVGSVGLEVFDILKEVVRECFLLARLAADEFELYKRLAWGAVDGEATCQYSSHRPVLDQQPEA